MMNSNNKEQSLERILEAILSVSDAPVSIVRMRNLFPEEGRPSAEVFEQALTNLGERYENSALSLVKVSSGYRFQTRAAYAQWINKLFETRPPKLSRALLETLSIIAYQQPVTRGDIQDVRGVAVSSEIIQKLLEREWIKKIGERDVPGRPSLFATTPEFLAYFNVQSLKDLPELHEPRALDDIARDLGDAAQIEIARVSAHSSEQTAAEAQDNAQTNLSLDEMNPANPNKDQT